jgi:NADH-quinone oxidoreductase subunit F
MELDPHAVRRGLHHRLLRHRRARGVHLRARRAAPLEGAPLGSHPEARAKGYLGAKPFGLDYPVDIVRAHRRRRVHLRRRDLAAQLARGQARRAPLKPPFPAQAGAFGMPTTVNNLETIATVPTVIEMGGEAFSKLSAPPPQGRRRAPLRRERPRQASPASTRRGGLTLRELIYDLGGGVKHGELLGGHPRRLVVPRAARRRARERARTRRARCTRGTARACSTCPWASTRSARSAPCSAPAAPSCWRHRPGARHAQPHAVLPPRVVRAVHAVPRGLRVDPPHPRQASSTARPTHGRARSLHEIANNIMGNTICAFGEGTAMPALGFLLKFRKELEAYVRTKGKGAPRRAPALPTEWLRASMKTDRRRRPRESLLLRPARAGVLVGGVARSLRRTRSAARWACSPRSSASRGSTCSSRRSSSRRSRSSSTRAPSWSSSCS